MNILLPEPLCRDCGFSESHCKCDAATVIQPLPTGDGQSIADMVCQDIQERKKVGALKYGKPLHANNGRNALIDAYQEALDLCQYLRQKIQEEKGCGK